MLPQLLAAAGQAALPGVMNAVGNFAQTGMGNAQGRMATAGLNAESAFDAMQRQGVTLDPSQQAGLANQLANQAAAEETNRSYGQQAFGAGLGNTAANLNTQRAMALNAQANAAQNVANQLNNLANARQSSAMMANQAIQGSAGLFR